MKSTQYVSPGKKRFGICHHHRATLYTEEEIDFLVVYIVPLNLWYIIPVKARPRHRGHSRLRSVLSLRPEESGNRLEPHRPFKIVYASLYADVRPSFIVDITPFIEQRHQALMAYRSQYANQAAGSGLFVPEEEIRERTFAEARHYGLAGRRALRRAFCAEGSGPRRRPDAGAGAVDLKHPGPRKLTLVDGKFYSRRALMFA